ncbi:hypothetical protein H8D85_01080 [bacterium]|nr:hypothetical protein [bacterium]
MFFKKYKEKLRRKNAETLKKAIKIIAKQQELDMDTRFASLESKIDVLTAALKSLLELVKGEE